MEQVWNTSQTMNAVAHLFTRYDEARERSNKGANMFSEVSDLADRMEDAADDWGVDSELQAEWDALCFRLGHA
jgi:hypothetical protein